VKRGFILGLFLLMVGCSSSTEVFFLNRLVTLDDQGTHIVEREFLPVVVLRYRWLSSSRALVYGMDARQERSWWLWDGWRKTFVPLGGDVQGFDVGGQQILAIGREWRDGFSLQLGHLRGKRFVVKTNLLLPYIPENSLGGEDGFYIAARDENGIHEVFFLSSEGDLKRCLSLTNREATLRFGRIGGRRMVYTSYEKEGGVSLFAFLDEKSPQWQEMTSEGTVVQKAVFLEDVVGFPVMRRGRIFWLVLDQNMRVVGRGGSWDAVVFEEVSPWKRKPNLFVCLLPDEKRSVLVRFLWDGVNWTWKVFRP